MRDTRLLFQLIEKDYLFKLILALALFALVPFVEILFVIYLGYLIGNWLVVVLAVLAGLPGVLVGHAQLEDIRDRIRARIRAGAFPGSELSDLLCVLVAGALLLTPGFLTDILGYLLLVPLVRSAVARMLARKLDRGLHDIYEYFRLREL